jgi:cytidyltransferase-like protein
MKSFLQLVEEQNKTHNPVAMAFGRMNPPTTGHMKLIDKVREHADKAGAKHTIVVSHSQDAKKNPLSAEQKLKHLKRYSPGTHFEASSKEHPTILHHAARLHAQGHDHLIVVGGSDRVKEYHDLLHKYNGVEGRHGHYNFKKIEVKSAGHRDPDAEGAEGMSATKMREHAHNNDFSSFRQGVPHHVSDNHARELMRDVRKGMGLHESVDRGLFKAIFVTGGPGSGKDVVIREAIPESRAVEMNTVQAYDYLADKQKLSEKTGDYRRESIRSRSPLIINGPAEDLSRISYIKEELEELGYDTLMIFVDTTNEVSQQRNTKLLRMMNESVRQEKWNNSQNSKRFFYDLFESILIFDNSGSIEQTEENISDVYQLTNQFIEYRVCNELAESWLENHGKLNINDRFNKFITEDNVKKNSKSIQRQTVTRYNPSFKAAGPTDIPADNRAGGEADQIKGDQNPRKDPNGKTVSGGAWSGGYKAEAAQPTLTKRPEPKESNFSQDKDKIKRKKFGDKSLSASRLGKPPGVGPEYDTRAGGQGAAAGAGLGDQTYSEDYVGQTASNADVSNFAGTTGVSVNPLDARYQPKPFNKIKKSLKEFNGFQNDVESGVGGVLGGASNKEGMDTYKDQNRNIGILINKKKKKQEK